MKRATLEKMVFILPMLTHIIPIWIKDNLILIQSWIMIWLRCFEIVWNSKQDLNMDWNFIIAHVPIQKICFALIILILVNIYFFFLHDLLTRIYTNVYHMFTYEQSWSYQTKRSAHFGFIEIITHVSIEFSTTSYSRWCCFWLVVSFIVR